MMGDKILTMIELVWEDGDVKAQAQGKNIVLTKEEISDVLWNLKNRHDASIGVCWETISYYIDEVVEARVEAR